MSNQYSCLLNEKCISVYFKQLLAYRQIICEFTLMLFNLCYFLIFYMCYLLSSAFKGERYDLLFSHTVGMRSHRTLSRGMIGIIIVIIVIILILMVVLLVAWKIRRSSLARCKVSYSTSMP